MEMREAVTCVSIVLTVVATLLPVTSASSDPGPAPKPDPTTASSVSSAEQGRKLFEKNCAHCHGDDARGDEGPDLHNLALSDARITKRIKEGIKGEMPKFASKLNDEDIRSLIAYLRSLEDDSK